MWARAGNESIRIETGTLVAVVTVVDVVNSCKASRPLVFWSFGWSVVSLVVVNSFPGMGPWG